MKTFYHVVTEHDMVDGQVISFDENHQSGVCRRVLREKEIVKDIYDNKENYNEDEFDHNIKVALRELALEEVRLDRFPNYPSRLACLYVSKKLEDALMWADSFIKNGRKTYAIVVVETDGREFTGDAYNCFDGSIDHDKNIELATRYWSNFPNTCSKNPIMETIIDGNIVVKKILKRF